MKLLLILGLISAICLVIGDATPEPNKKAAPVVVKKPRLSVPPRKKTLPIKSIKKREADADPNMKKQPLRPLPPPIKKSLPKTPPLQPIKMSKGPIKKKPIDIKPIKSIKKREADAYPNINKRPLPPVGKPMKKRLQPPKKIIKREAYPGQPIIPKKLPKMPVKMPAKNKGGKWI